jgi:hypothetical protein
LKEIAEPEVRETAGDTLPAPQGIGMAVAFDWGLAVQMLVTPVVSVFRRPGPVAGTVLSFLAAWLAASGLLFFGEMVRRGRNWTRWIQILANTLLSCVGVFSLVSLLQSLQARDFWPLATEVILVIFSPLIVWRLSRPPTGRWFQAVTVGEARRRHGGSWVWFIALWAIAGGVLQTLAAMSARP